MQRRVHIPPLKIVPSREIEKPKKPRADMTPEERATEIVDHLRDVIENRKEATEKPGGMSYKDWRKLARKEIAEALRDAALRAAVGEVMSARRIGNLMLRAGFMILAAVFSFAAFWYGVVLVGQEYGTQLGILAAVSALALSIGFLVVGVLVGNKDGDPKDQIDPDLR
ncbi:MAG: hypothetical protein KJ904_14440 [Alphaproteobacteria bacterium]|nr:hypothetical protein [Alphaproteobacteria bacterium]MBU0796978.1 hypothetical protein [Alphaproteobacteria bacterium]MBU0888353.1 hypothetical protein [Alphaproteobacteria bacterium]MBU1814664.1 hypothetical protein [Alphaproteobacteria bacterium]MBU2091993.1 hypothetical protein [Alphaproteobacteria bacterium]